jgi:hypothetical protein
MRPMRLAAGLLAVTLLSSCGGGGGSAGDPLTPPPEPGPVIGPAWPSFGRSAQNDAVSSVQAQPLARKVWQAVLDQAPQYTGGGSLLVHYGSPVITTRNTVVLPVKTGASGGFKVEARRGSDGLRVWSADTGYRMPQPAPGWVPSFNPALTSDGKLVYPTAGGRLVWRDDPDRATSTLRTVAFYGTACDSAPTSCDDTVFINTPITPDGEGGVYFGFTVGGANAAGLVGGGIAHVAANGSGRYVLAADAAGDAGTTKPATNSAPALSADGATLYVVVNVPLGPGRERGRLLALNTVNLSTQASVPLLDPANGATAWVSDDGTASPLVAPDGDVYIGVLESATANHNFRGWLLHFDATLATPKLPAAFGWDITPSIVPAAMMPGYAGGSPYLLALKYNNYGGAGTGDGANRIAIVDPRQSQPDPVGGVVPVMREVITALGLTSDPNWAGGVKEWCINTMAVDPATQSVLVNSEDGVMYRWHLPSNTFTQNLRLNSGLGQAYTPTAVGPDGRVYAVSNAVLYSIGQ